MLCSVEALGSLKRYTGEKPSHPICYLTLLLGRRTLSCRIPGVSRGQRGLQPNFLIRPGARGAGCPEPCPASFECLQGWRHHYRSGQPLPVLDHDSNFFLYWARISCAATWVHRVTSLVKSRLDHSFTNPIEFIWTVLSSFTVNWR